MKKLYFLLLSILISTASFGQIYSESFEGTSLYTTSEAEISDGFYDFFTSTNGSNIDPSFEYTGVDGTFFFAACDIDGEGITLPATLTTNSIDVTGLSEITFAVSLAEDDDGTNQDWDDGDYLHITYSIDGGTDQDLIWVEGDGSTGTIYNQEPAIDTDFNGIGDGAKITSTFVEHTKNVVLSSNTTITFKFEFQLNSGDEDIAIDKIVVTDAATASVVENQIEGFSMYPNPAVDGSFTISSKSNTVKQVEIYSLLGNLVISKSVRSNEKIDVSNLSSGFYMVKVEEEGKIATRKLLVK